MLHIRIETKVNQSAQEVMDGFDEDLFKALKPPLMTLNLHRFDGCEKGDKVELEVGLLTFLQPWHALVTEHGEDEEKLYFTDIGARLPFPLKDWTHRHQILKHSLGSTVVDDITYKTVWFPFDYLMYPVIYMQFWLRKKIYRQFFN